MGQIFLIAQLGTNTGLRNLHLWVCVNYLFRKYDSLFKMLSRAEVPEVTRITGCQKPCRYNKYIIVGERRRTTFESKDFTFSLWAVSNRTEIRKEKLLYPLSSLVADFGGTLGLFLGFSFMTLWDQIQFLGYFTRALKMCRGDFFRHTNWKVFAQKPYNFFLYIFYTFKNIVRVKL